MNRVRQIEFLQRDVDLHHIRAAHAVQFDHVFLLIGRRLFLHAPRQWNRRPESMTMVWPVIVSVRHMVTTMSAQSSLSAAFFSSEVAAERSIISGSRLAVARVPSSKPGAMQLTSVSGARATAMQR